MSARARTAGNAAAFAFALALAAAIGSAAPVASARERSTVPAPGEYAMRDGGGTLTITPGPGPGLQFQIETLGANGHVCALDGEMRHAHATLIDTPGAEPCIIRFGARMNGVDVSTNEAASCRIYCGDRAGFVGRYLLAPPGCTNAGRASSRSAFQRLYDLRDYRGALQVAEPLLQRCADTMDRVELGRLRNDLAVTHYHLGERADCLRMLAPMIEVAGRPDDALRDELPPTDADAFLPVVRAARTNLRLCRALRTP